MQCFKYCRTAREETSGSCELILAALLDGSFKVKASERECVPELKNSAPDHQSLVIHYPFSSELNF